jgi:RNA polymerase sigma-70 factor (ECF subfamily)
MPPRDQAPGSRTIQTFRVSHAPCRSQPVASIALPPGGHWQAVFERYYRELLAFLSHRLRDRDTAADLAQESYARVYASERAGTPIHDPRALLYTTARNLVTDHHRRSQVRGGGAESTADDEAADPDAHAGPGAHEPDALLETRQRFEALAAIVDSLPPRCREVFLLIRIEGLSYAEAAAAMGIAVKTVEMQMKIAMDACWERMERLDGSAPVRTRPAGRSKAR